MISVLEDLYSMDGGGAIVVIHTVEVLQLEAASVIILVRGVNEPCAGE